MNFKIYSDGALAQILVEDSAFEGVKLVANAHADDIKLVCGKKPEIVSSVSDVKSKSVIIAATVGKSSLLDSLKI